MHFFKKKNFLGSAFFDGPLVEAAFIVHELAHSRTWTYVATPNASHIVRIHESCAIADVYRKASLLLLDSKFVHLISKLAGLNPPSVVTGADLTDYLFNHLIKYDTRVCVIGCDESTIGSLKARFGLTNVIHYNPPMNLYSNPSAISKVISTIEESRAEYTFLAVGSPQQEIIAAQVGDRAIGVGLCVGASLEFLGGKLPRAPAWMRRFGIEWLFRFFREPRRLFKRYFYESPKVISIVVSASLSRVSKASGLDR
jgi:exopolysaccharide biosynthesis WecB/TagA/CpsF family protein